MRRFATTLVGIGLVIVWAAPASAHVTVQPNEALAGGFQAFVVQVPNERDDDSTIKIAVEFPPLASVSFQDVAGWERKVEMVEFDEPIEAFGEEIAEGVGTVTWSGGEIEPGEFQRFGFSVGPVPEDDLEFPALQTYDSGEVVRWIGSPDSEEPAALVHPVDLGVEEGQGQLAALADIKQQVEALAGAEGDESDTPNGGALILSIVAIGLALLSLIVTLTRRRA